MDAIFDVEDGQTCLGHLLVSVAFFVYVALFVDRELDIVDDLKNEIERVLQTDREIVCLGDTGKIVYVVGIRGGALAEAVLVFALCVVSTCYREQFRNHDLRSHPCYRDPPRGTRRWLQLRCASS